MDFENFIGTHSTFKRLKDSILAKRIYDEIIWDENNRIRMAEFSDSGKPALEACALEIERICASDPNPDIDLGDDTTRRIIGRMVSAALKPLGYVSVKKSRLSYSLGLTKFKNAAVFKLTGNAKQRIEKKIVVVS